MQIKQENLNATMGHVEPGLVLYDGDELESDPKKLIEKIANLSEFDGWEYPDEQNETSIYQTIVLFVEGAITRPISIWFAEPEQV